MPALLARQRRFVAGTFRKISDRCSGRGRPSMLEKVLEITVVLLCEDILLRVSAAGV